MDIAVVYRQLITQWLLMWYICKNNTDAVCNMNILAKLAHLIGCKFAEDEDITKEIDLSNHHKRSDRSISLSTHISHCNFFLSLLKTYGSIKFALSIKRRNKRIAGFPYFTQKQLKRHAVVSKLKTRICFSRGRLGFPNDEKTCKRNIKRVL